MKRIETLINKLKLQSSQGASTEQLLATTKLLITELSTTEMPEQIGKVSVWMPEIYFSSAATTNAITEMNEENIVVEMPHVANIEEYACIESNTIYSDLMFDEMPKQSAAFELPTDEDTQANNIEYTSNIEMVDVENEVLIAEATTEEVVEQNMVEENALPVAETAEIVEPSPQKTIEEIVAEINKDLPAPIDETSKSSNAIDAEIVNTRVIALTQKPKEVYSIILDETDEEEEQMPTLVMHTKDAIELNDLVKTTNKSFNDVLRENRAEVAATLTETPVRDLRKAIGINDKYKFIKELFRGDETMYERSIKTINNFAVFPEAEQWMKRELNTKLCWIESDESVKQFECLVRRRFA